MAGILLIAALSLASLVDGRWIYLALLPAFGLMLDALAGVCPMTLMLKKAPWNSVR